MATLYWNSTPIITASTTAPLWIWGSATSTTVASAATWYAEWHDVSLAVEDHLVLTPSHLDSTLSLLDRWTAEPEHREHEFRSRQTVRQDVRRAVDEAHLRRAQAENARIEAERARLKQAEERSEAARTRALALLRSHLTPAQRRTFEANKWFVVEGGRSKTRYRINSRHFAGNIEILDGERVTHHLCGHCDHTIPLSDQLLAQKLMLEFDEDEFLKLANRRAA